MNSLSPSSQKTLEALKLKADWRSNGARMPSLRKVHELFVELNIIHNFYTTTARKWSKSAGRRYYTSGGSRDYNGAVLFMKGLHLDSTETYYSYNTTRYAEQILNIISKS